MAALVLDAGGLIAIDRSDRSTMARLRVAHLRGYDLRTSAIVLAQVWRGSGGKQANIARILRAADVRSVDERMGRDAGVLLAKARTDTAIDATVVLVARAGDRVLTSDPGDIAHLASCRGKKITVVPC